VSGHRFASDSLHGRSAKRRRQPLGPNCHRKRAQIRLAERRQHRARTHISALTVSVGDALDVLAGNGGDEDEDDGDDDDLEDDDAA